MYTEFYGFLERPFELSPDIRYLYLSERHREALAHLAYGVEERRGFVQFTGEVGTGKTTMLDALVAGLDATTKVARLSTTTIDSMDLVRILAWEFEVETEGRSKAEILRDLSALFAERTSSGRNAVFVVDEAQNLALSVLEELRLLSNLRSDGRPSLQIILCGQPELRDKLDLHELRQLRQRISVRYHLGSLSREETREYIEHRLGVAGAARPNAVFEPAAIDAIYRYSGGVPRIVNTVCDRALLAGYADSASRIGRRLIEKTIEAVEDRTWETASGETDVGAEQGVSRAGREIGWRTTVAVAASVLALTAAATFWLGPDTATWTGLGDRTARASVGSPVDAISGAAVAETSTGRPASPAPNEGAAVAAQHPYVIVARSVPDGDDTEGLVEELEARGHDTAVVSADLGAKGTWQRVLIAQTYEALDDAVRDLSELRAAGFPGAWIMRAPDGIEGTPASDDEAGTTAESRRTS